MRILIGGGCKNQKSLFAQQIVRIVPHGLKYYIATMAPTDGEDKKRIENHQNERKNWGFQTVEQPLDIIDILSRCDKGGSALLDSTTALLANEMFADNEYNPRAYQKVTRELLEVSGHFACFVVVSDYIYSDANRYDEFTEAYRLGLAKIDRCLAKEFDVVLESCFGELVVHKGGEFDEINYWRSLPGKA